MAGAKLTDTQISRTKVKDKPYKLADGGGLFLYVTPAGGKYWRWAYRFEGRPQLLSIGEYPAMCLKDARTAHQHWQGDLRRGVNPAVEKKVEKKAKTAAVKLGQERSALAAFDLPDDPTKKVLWPAGSFGAVQTEWFEKWSSERAPSYIEQMRKRMAADVLPRLGHRHMMDIEASDIAQMAVEIESRGAAEVARKALWATSQIFRFAIPKKYAQRNPAADFKPRDVLKTHTAIHHPRVSDRDLPRLLLKMENDTGTEITRTAMWLMARTFLRTSELVQAPWAEIDLEQGWWTIPGKRMKTGDFPHIVPLSRQVIAKLRALRELTGDSDYVFPGARDRGNKTMSTGGISEALKRMKYRGTMTGHGFRGVASTILHEGAKVSPLFPEGGYPDAWIELQLAHLPRNKVSAAYNYAEHLDGRKQMMQDWSDFLDEQLNKAKQGATAAAQ